MQGPLCAVVRYAICTTIHSSQLPLSPCVAFITVVIKDLPYYSFLTEYTFSRKDQTLSWSQAEAQTLASY